MIAPKQETWLQQAIFWIGLALLSIILIGLLVAVSPSYAHEVGCDGKPPVAAIKASCCGDHDWARLQPGQWKESGGVYSVFLDGQWYPVVYGGEGGPVKPLPSTDGCDYVWYRRQGENTFWNDDETSHAGMGEIHFFCLQLSMAF